MCIINYCSSSFITYWVPCCLTGFSHCILSSTHHYRSITRFCMRRRFCDWRNRSNSNSDAVLTVLLQNKNLSNDARKCWFNFSISLEQMRCMHNCVLCWVWKWKNLRHRPNISCSSTLMKEASPLWYLRTYCWIKLTFTNVYTQVKNWETVMQCNSVA